MSDNGFSEIALRAEARALVSRMDAHAAFEWLRRFALDHPEIPEATHAFIAWERAADQPRRCTKDGGGADSSAGDERCVTGTQTGSSN